MQRKTNRSTLFHYRLVVSLPPWAVFVMAGAVALGLLDKPLLVTNIVSMVACAIAVVLVYVARREVKKLRYEMHSIITDIGNEELDEQLADNVTPLPQPITLRRSDGHANARL